MSQIKTSRKQVLRHVKSSLTRRLGRRHAARARAPCSSSSLGGTICSRADEVAGGAPRIATSDRRQWCRSYGWKQRTGYPVGGGSQGAFGIQAAKKKGLIAAAQKMAGGLALGVGRGPGPGFRPEVGSGCQNNLGHAVLPIKAIQP